MQCYCKSGIIELGNVNGYLINYCNHILEQRNFLNFGPEADIYYTKLIPYSFEITHTPTHTEPVETPNYQYSV